MRSALDDSVKAEEVYRLASCGSSAGHLLIEFGAHAREARASLPFWTELLACGPTPVTQSALHGIEASSAPRSGLSGTRRPPSPAQYLRAPWHRARTCPGFQTWRSSRRQRCKSDLQALRKSIPQVAIDPNHCRLSFPSPGRLVLFASAAASAQAFRPCLSKRRRISPQPQTGADPWDRSQWVAVRALQSTMKPSSGQTRSSASSERPRRRCVCSRRGSHRPRQGRLLQGCPCSRSLTSPCPGLRMKPMTCDRLGRMSSCSSSAQESLGVSPQTASMPSIGSSEVVLSALSSAETTVLRQFRLLYGKPIELVGFCAQIAWGPTKGLTAV